MFYREYWSFSHTPRSSIEITLRWGVQFSDVVLKMITGFVTEDSYVVWRCINTCFSKFKVVLAEENCCEDLNRFMLKTMSSIVDQIGWKPKEGEHHTQGLLRMIIISRMGVLGHAATVKEAKERFQNHIKGVEEIPADLRAPVYRVVAANGDNSTYEQVRIF